jgi:hypothetical protein
MVEKQRRENRTNRTAPLGAHDDENLYTLVCALSNLSDTLCAINTHHHQTKQIQEQISVKYGTNNWNN